jgi:arginyl-tRNA synthetase
MWSYIVGVSLKDFKRIYKMLGVHFPDDAYIGESFYQDKVDDAIGDLQRFVSKTLDDHSILLYTGIKEAKPNAKEEVPLILRKSDGAHGYGATDAAAIRYRLLKLKADRILYVTDTGQSLHFHLLFAAAKMAGTV